MDTMLNSRPRNFDAGILQQQEQLDVSLVKNESSVKKEEVFDEVKFSPMKTNHIMSQDQSIPSTAPNECSDSSSVESVVLNLTSDASVEITDEKFDDNDQNTSYPGSFEMIEESSDMMISLESLKNVFYDECSLPVHQCLKLELKTDSNENVLEIVQDTVYYVDEEIGSDGKEIVREEGRDPLYISDSERQEILPNIPALSKQKGKIERIGSGENRKQHGTLEQNDTFDEDDESEENYDLSERKLQELRSLVVTLKHEVPPQHEVEQRAGTHSLSEIELEAFERHGPVKSGPFSTHEDQQIKDNWKYFCEVHHWDERKVQPFLQMRHGRQYYIRSLKQRKNFVKFLAKDLPWRTLYSVYSRFKILFNTELKKGPYTSEEDEIILSLQNPSQQSEKATIAEVANVLKRTKRSVNERFKKLKNKVNMDPSPITISTKDSRNARSPATGKIPNDETTHDTTSNTVNWTASLIEKFMETLLRLTGGSVDDLECKMIDDKIWAEMQEIMNISRVTLEKYWYLQLYMQIFSPQPINYNQISMKLLRHLQRLGVRAIEDLNWDKLVLNFVGVTPYFLSLLLENLVLDAQTMVESHEKINIFEYLYRDYLEKLKGRTRNFFLPKLEFSNGKITNIDSIRRDRIPADPFKINKM